MTEKNDGSRHHWRFFRSGGLDQVRIDSGDDLLALDQLDQKLWAALSCPVNGLRFDRRTLDYLDADADGRVRVPEVLAAVRWCNQVLKDPALLLQSASQLALSDINTSHIEGAQLHASARQILINLGKEGADVISVDDTTDLARIFADTRFNGDGIITPESTDDLGVAAVINEVMQYAGEAVDRSGHAGASREQAETFFAAIQAYAHWWTRTEVDASILPLGRDTPAAVALWQQVRGKVDDYFTRCRLASYDARAGNALTPMEKDYESLAVHTLTRAADEVADFPLATIAAGKPLPLIDGVNPAWSNAIRQLQTNVVTPLLGERNTLDFAAWSDLCDRFQPYLAWFADKQGVIVEPLGIDRVRAILAGDYQSQLMALYAQDMALEQESNGIVSVDRLLHYYRDLTTLLNNFVSFRDFYSGKQKGIFQAGTLYLDGRSCDLCVPVDDVAKHVVLASLSRTYMVYCLCKRRDSSDSMHIAACITAGDSDQLVVGRNGVFYDRDGQDWDATIVRIIDHPISIRQAIWSPYKRIGRMVGEQVEKLASSRAKDAEANAAANLLEGASKAEPAKVVAFDVGKFAGIFAAIGLAIGAIGTALATVATSFLQLMWWQMPLAILGAMMLVSGPSMIIAWLKLRQRNLGPILDANGWAVNTRAKINIAFGTTLTGTAKLPEGAQRSLDDPFADKKRPWWLYLFVLITIAVLLAVLIQRGVFG